MHVVPHVLQGRLHIVFHLPRLDILLLQPLDRLWWHQIGVNEGDDVKFALQKFHTAILGYPAWATCIVCIISMSSMFSRVRRGESRKRSFRSRERSIMVLSKWSTV